ncbi:hypothetical protein KIN20_006558 [Parelaphostrongylus tenuis]|uniref:Uncharacterized protein n=1 Tax=Parelaphostrongylus tenuis TaxID=148309 RepID=A0AAD5QJE3_PARTN|nr:hypothetical protein KIN20_006558 [Parelaphostrongylus tenuis]
MNFLLTTTVVLGCGTLPAGPAAMKTWRFNVTGFSLPVAMVFSTAADVQAQIPGISPSSNSAEAFVKHLVIQGVHDVLEQQGRAAGLPDAIITIILGQLAINVLYTPLNCPLAKVDSTAQSMRNNMRE